MTSASSSYLTEKLISRYTSDSLKGHNLITFVSEDRLTYNLNFRQRNLNIWKINSIKDSDMNEAFGKKKCWILLGIILLSIVGIVVGLSVHFTATESATTKTPVPLLIAPTTTTEGI